MHYTFSADETSFSITNLIKCRSHVHIIYILQLAWNIELTTMNVTVGPTTWNLVLLSSKF